MDQNPIHQTVREIHAMSRGQCIDALTHFRDIPLDFDESFLSQMSLERLRHVLLAAVLTVHRRRSA
ncbi:MAG: hypothetical protein GC162_10025 [Planctomycetes bacterium]|nr:hypothetical protein [Planctomycetota bacterium]